MPVATPCRQPNCKNVATADRFCRRHGGSNLDLPADGSEPTGEVLAGIEARKAEKHEEKRREAEANYRHERVEVTVVAAPSWWVEVSR